MNKNTKNPKLVSHKEVFESLPEDEKVAVRVQVIRLDLANRVRKARKVKGISSEKLAELSGVSYKTISKIENAKPVTFDSVVRVLQPLDLDVTYSWR